MVQRWAIIEVNNFLIPYLQTIIMIKKLISGQTSAFLFKTLFNTLAYSQPTPAEHKQPLPQKKAYEILLQNSIDNLIKSPSQGVLKALRSRGIAKIMAANHNLYDMHEVLEVHVECLNALIHRIQPSIDAIAMFTEKIYMEIEHLRETEISAPSLLNLLKPSIITKIVKISQSIDPFYNESFRGLISILIVKLMEKSIKNEVAHQSAMRSLSEELNLLKKGLKQVDSEGNLVNLQNLGGWHWKKTQELDEKYRHINELDYWNGFQFILSMEYYTDSFLMTNITCLQKALEKDIRSYSFNELIIKIKCVVELNKFKNSKLVGEKGLRTLLFSYNKMVEQYFKLLSTQANIFELINSDEAIIQTQLLTSFLTTQHYQLAKKVYLEVFKVALNISSNGTLLIDVKRLRGIFEVMLILYTHEDTKQVHALLGQLEKVMNIYPLDKFEKLQTHCYVCEKFGYRSDFFAEKFYNHLLIQKKKLQRNRGHLHRVHQVSRELLLAQKFLMCTKIMCRPIKQQLQEASKIINGLFDPNVWFCLNQTDTGFETFLTASAFSHHIYFQRIGIKNITLGGYERRRIQGIILQTGLKNLNKQYHQILQDLRGYGGSKSNSKLDHISSWRLNAHARMKTVLELGNFNYQYLKKNNTQDASNFIQLFLTKTLGSTLFYNSLKQRFAYPGIMEQYIQLMEKSNVKSFQIQVRDLQAIKRMYQAQLQRILKHSQKPNFSLLYQDHLDFIQLNRAVIPTNPQVYGLSNIANCAAVSLLHQAMKRFQKQKQYVKMQIQTFMKFNKTGEILVTTNYMQFPFLGDVRVSHKEESMMALFRHYQGDISNFLNYKQLDLQRQSQAYWKKKGYQVYILKNQKDIEEFMKKITKLSAKGER